MAHNPPPGAGPTVETSALPWHRNSHVVPARMGALKDGVLRHDFPTFERVTMQYSNRFHGSTDIISQRCPTCDHRIHLNELLV
jgi:hypothetical protein